jgi:4-amino-4-deoxy-L-arabinose transferase-like glycosyltransferase
LGPPSLVVLPIPSPRRAMDNTGRMAELLRDRIVRAMVLLAFAVRALYATAVPVRPVSDSFAYDTFAFNLARYGTFGWQPDVPSAFWPPGTSFLYSLLYRVFGHTYWPIALLNVLLGTAVVALSVPLAWKWFGRRIAYGTGLVLAFWPSLILYTTVLASELPFIVITLAAMSLFAAAPQRIVTWLLTGALLGLAAHVRTEALLLPLVFAASYPPALSLLRRACGAGLMLTALVLLVTPWCYRNSRIYGAPTFLTTSAGTNFWMGNNPGTKGDYMEPPYAEGRDERAQDQHLRDLAIEFVRSRPGTFVTSSLLKALRLHERETSAFVWSERGLAERVGSTPRALIKWGAQFYWLVTLALSLIGLVISFSRNHWRTLLHPALLFWAYMTTLHATTVALQDRYHFPSDPFIAMFAGVSLVALWDRELYRVRRLPESFGAGE